MSLISREVLMIEVRQLEPLPTSAARLASLVCREDYLLDEIAAVVVYDQVLTGKVIHAANSAVSSGVMPITTTREAIARMGIGQVLSYVIAKCVGRLMQQPIPELGLPAGQLWRESVTAALAAELSPAVCRHPPPPETMTAALLHNVGKLVLSRFLNPEPIAGLQPDRSEDLDLIEVEQETLKIHHAEVGAMVAEHWKLAEPIVQGIRFHHRPEPRHALVSHGTHLAYVVAQNLNRASEGSIAGMEIKPEAVDRLGLKGGGLEELCEETTSRYEELSKRYEA